jgi:adenosine deaminase
MIQQGRVNAGPDYADLHRHVGGAVHPKVLYGYLATRGPDAGATPTEREVIRGLLGRFPTYTALKEHFATRRPTLDDYLELHKLVEPLQTPATMGYFLYRIVRGARIFEQTSLLELRFTPYLRTDPARTGRSASPRWARSSRRSRRERRCQNTPWTCGSCCASIRCCQTK